MLPMEDSRFPERLIEKGRIDVEEAMYPQRTRRTGRLSGDSEDRTRSLVQGRLMTVASL